VTAYELAKTLVVGLVLPPGGPLLLAIAPSADASRAWAADRDQRRRLFILAMPAVDPARRAFSSTSVGTVGSPGADTIVTRRGVRQQLNSDTLSLPRRVRYRPGWRANHAGVTGGGRASRPAQKPN
jgi:hypothetical protein